MSDRKLRKALFDLLKEAKWIFHNDIFFMQNNWDTLCRHDRKLGKAMVQAEAALAPRKNQRR